MPLATQQDVEARLGRALSDAEAARLPSLLSDASAILAGYLGRDYATEVAIPEAVSGVAAKMVARNLLAGASPTPFATQQSAGAFSVSYNSDAASGDVWLTAADKLALRPYRRSGGVASVQLVGERYRIED